MDVPLAENQKFTCVSCMWASIVARYFHSSPIELAQTSRRIHPTSALVDAARLQKTAIWLQLAAAIYAQCEQNAAQPKMAPDLAHMESVFGTLEIFPSPKVS